MLQVIFFNIKNRLHLIKVMKLQEEEEVVKIAAKFISIATKLVELIEKTKKMLYGVFT